MWRKCHNFDEICVTDCTESCRYDNFQCSQWRKLYQNDVISISMCCASVIFVLQVSPALTTPCGSSPALSADFLPVAGHGVTVCGPFCRHMSSVPITKYEKVCLQPYFNASLIFNRVQMSAVVLSGTYSYYDNAVAADDLVLHKMIINCYGYYHLNGSSGSFTMILL